MTTDSDRIARLEGIVEEIRERLNAIDGRFNTIEGRFNTIEGRFNTIEGRFNSLEERMEARFNLLTQLILGTWITAIVAIIAIGAAILLRQ